MGEIKDEIFRLANHLSRTPADRAKDLRDKEIEDKRREAAELRREARYERIREFMEYSNEPLMRWFEFQHLPMPQQLVSSLFAGVAEILVEKLPRCPERTVALRKLLEAKDAAVRASLEAGDADLRPGPTGNETVPGLWMAREPDTRVPAAEEVDRPR